MMNREYADCDSHALYILVDLVVVINMVMVDKGYLVIVQRFHMLCTCVVDLVVLIWLCDQGLSKYRDGRGNLPGEQGKSCGLLELFGKGMKLNLELFEIF